MAKRTGKLFLNERLCEANRRVRELKNERRGRELTLKRMLTAEDFDQLQRTSNVAAEKAFERLKIKQREKFESLYKSVRERDERTTKKVDKRKWVVNLSSRPLSLKEEEVLRKGMKYAPTPKVIPKKEVVAKVETVLRDKVEPEKAERARAAVSSVLKTVKKPKMNVSKEEWKAVSTLRNDSTIVILEAYKGNTTVVMDSMEYEKKSNGDNQ